MWIGKEDQFFKEKNANFGTKLGERHLVNWPGVGSE